ncbi:hypothetical protein [Sporichthya polymorpha]|uniref:hypothetical protein n=1 Tax=Sporichthya polymorpha TaxID=35751 RepID=UPI000370F6FF|nr:hypothetical protein [Sporichthya polymorpha]
MERREQRSRSSERSGRTRDNVTVFEWDGSTDPRATVRPPRAGTKPPAPKN